MPDLSNIVKTTTSATNYTFPAGTHSAILLASAGALAEIEDAAAGTPVTIPSGSQITIGQGNLGGYTIYVESGTVHIIVILREA